MDQKVGRLFIDLLNKIAVDNVDQSCEDMLKSCFMQKHDLKYPLYACHILAVNVPSQEHDSFKLKNIPNKLFSIPAKVQILEHCSISDLSETQNQK